MVLGTMRAVAETGMLPEGRERAVRRMMEILCRLSGSGGCSMGGLRGRCGVPTTSM
jgi:hypothetical protein